MSCQKYLKRGLADSENYFVFPVYGKRNRFSSYPKIDTVNMQYVNSPTNALKGLEMATADSVLKAYIKLLKTLN